MARQKPETKLTKKIRVALQMKRCFVVKVNPGLYSKAGLPDLVGCLRNGHFFGLEVKMPGREKTLTMRQAQNLKKIKKAGGIAAVVTSVEEALEALGLE